MRRLDASFAEEHKESKSVTSRQHAQQQLHALALPHLASSGTSATLSFEEIKRYKDAFDRLDAGKTGKVASKELFRAFKDIKTVPFFATLNAMDRSFTFRELLQALFPKAKKAELQVQY